MKNPFSFSRATAAWAISAAVIGLVAAAMLIPMSRPSGKSDTATSAVQPKPAAAPAETAAPRRASAARARAPKTRTADAKATIAKESPAGPSVQELALVTITGCLEIDDETFRLKATSGADAPKARSWKTGFLRKRPAAIEVVDVAKGIELPDHVGERVSVTGVLMDREMQVHSLQRVASSCDKTPAQVGTDASAKTSS